MIDTHSAFLPLQQKRHFSTSDIIDDLAEALEVFGNLP